MFGRKAVSGQVITLIITLVVALGALVILAAFTRGAMPAVSQIMEDAVTGIKTSICKQITGGWFC
jgi:hypothetical protein